MLINFFCILWTQAPIPSLFICKLMCPTGEEEQQTLPILKIRLWHGNRVAERHWHEFSSCCVQGRAYASYTCTSGRLPGMESTVRARFPRRASTEAGDVQLGWFLGARPRLLLQFLPRVSCSANAPRAERRPDTARSSGGRFSMRVLLFLKSS